MQTLQFNFSRPDPIILCLGAHCDDIEIGFNAKFLIEILSHLESEEVEVLLSAPNRAGLIIPKEKDENEDILMLVMPVMLNNYV